MTPLHAFPALILSITIHLIVITGLCTAIDTTTYSTSAAIHVNLNYADIPSHSNAQPANSSPSSTEQPNTGILQPNNQATNTNLETPQATAKDLKTKRVARKIVENPAELAKTSTLEETATVKSDNHNQVDTPHIEPPSRAPQQPSDTFTEASTTTRLALRYPPFSRRRGEEGTVTLSVEINEHGKVDFVDIIRSSGHTRLDEAARSAALKASYTPAKRNHQVVASTKQLEINFRLNDPSYN